MAAPDAPRTGYNGSEPVQADMHMLCMLEIEVDAAETKHVHSIEPTRAFYPISENTPRNFCEVEGGQSVLSTVWRSTVLK